MWQAIDFRRINVLVETHEKSLLALIKDMFKNKLIDLLFCQLRLGTAINMQRKMNFR